MPEFRRVFFSQENLPKVIDFVNLKGHVGIFANDFRCGHASLDAVDQMGHFGIFFRIRRRNLPPFLEGIGDGSLCLFRISPTAFLTQIVTVYLNRTIRFLNVSSRKSTLNSPKTYRRRSIKEDVRVIGPRCCDLIAQAVIGRGEEFQKVNDSLVI